MSLLWLDPAILSGLSEPLRGHHREASDLSRAGKGMISFCLNVLFVCVCVLCGPALSWNSL